MRIEENRGDACWIGVHAARLPAGGINADNCKFYIENGASHVIVTSYVFRDGQIDYERLDLLKSLIGKEHLVRSPSTLFYRIWLCHARHRWR